MTEKTVSKSKQVYETKYFENMDGNFNDPFYFEGKDPARSYKHISYANFQKHGYRDPRGWVPLTFESKTTEVWPEMAKYEVKTDGFWHVGDLILAWMPRSRYDKMQEAKAEKTKSKTEGIVNAREVRDLAKKGNIPITDD